MIAQRLHKLSKVFSFVLATLLVLISNSTSSQSVTKLNFSATKNFTQEDFLRWSKIPIGSRYFTGIEDTISYRVLSGLRENGFFNSKIIEAKNIFNDDSSSVEIIFSIEENNPTLIRNIFFTQLDSIYKNKIAKEFEFLFGSIFIQRELINAINKSLVIFEDVGIPFAKIEIDKIFFLYDSISQKEIVDITLKFVSIEETRIDRIEIVGNTKTKNYVILRELKLFEGEVYSQTKIENLPRQLNRLRFFAPVKEPTFFINSINEGVLRIEITERETNNFDGIIGFIPATQNETGFFTGLANISLRNLFGTGRSGAVRWQKLDRHSQELQLNYLEPWLFGFPINLSLELFQRQQDTTFVQSKYESQLEFLATEVITFSLLLGTESVIPTINVVPRFTVFNSTTLSTGINFRYDTRDDPLSTRSGIYFSNSYILSRKTIKGPEQYLTPATERKVELQRLELLFHYYLEIFNRQVVAVKLNGRELRSNFYELSDLFILGGMKTLRGYRENQFMGSRVAWSNIEYRYLLTNRSYGFLFFDTGYYLRKADVERNIEKSEAIKTGFGLGINIESALGVLSVSFAMAKGDSFTDGKIHFGIISEF